MYAWDKPEIIPFVMNTSHTKPASVHFALCNTYMKFLTGYEYKLIRKELPRYEYWIDSYSYQDSLPNTNMKYIPS